MVIENTYEVQVKTTATKYGSLQQAILLYIKENGVAVLERIHHELEIPKNTVWYNLKKFKADGLIETVPSGDQRSKPYKLTPYGVDVAETIKRKPLKESDIIGYIPFDLSSEDSLKAAISFLEGKASAPIDLDERERILRYVEKICYFAEVYRNRKIKEDLETASV